MNYFKLLFLLICTSFSAVAQDFVLPLGMNADLFDKQRPFVAKSDLPSFDSTFIYKTDTIKITLSSGFLDEFSKNHFQQYVADFSGPNVTFEKYYKLMEDDGVTALPLNARFSNTVTVKKIINVATNTVTNVALPSQTIKVGDFSTYPPVYSTAIVYPPYTIYDTIDFVNDMDTVFALETYFFQDSATQFFNNISDPSAYWLDDNAYHNYRFAKDPWTLGVVTFDGLDRYGVPYFLGSSAKGLADILTSKPLDLSTLNPSSEVFMSFLYQTEGFGDAPEVIDSLVLQFYAPTVDQWFNVWSAKGATVSDFKKVHFKLNDTKYFQKGFQFRFMNYGGLSGSLDHFHIDYVHLRALSGPQDTLFKDFAFVYPVGSFLKEYTSVPWEHYKNNPIGKMNDQTAITVRNGSNIPENSQSGTAWVNYNGTTEGTYVLSDYELTGHDPQTNYQPLATIQSFHDFSTGYRFDETKPGDEQTFDLFATASVPYAQLTVNDSTFGQQVFSNYYAYDDGSAEQAYGLLGVQSMLAYQFTPYENDSLIGVKMHFVPTVQDVSNHLFLLTVWNDNNGKPGAKIYEDEFYFPRQPKYESSRNQFTDYYLADTMKLPITGTFYVGWRQLEGDKLCLGLDRNTNNQDKIFYSNNNGNSWFNTSYEGSLLMRPIFSTALDAVLSTEIVDVAEKTFNLYPNPAQFTVTIETNDLEYSGVQLFDLQGKLIGTYSDKTIDISPLMNGIYLLRDVHSGITKKMVKN